MLPWQNMYPEWRKMVPKRVQFLSSTTKYHKFCVPRMSETKNKIQTYIM